MTVPARYIDASADFKRFLLDLREGAGLGTTNQAYALAEGVLLTFRRRLPVPAVARFASALPPVLRAMFVANWDPEDPVASFDRAGIEAELTVLQPRKGLPADEAVRFVGVALRKNVDEGAFEATLRRLPDGADQFWRR